MKTNQIIQGDCIEVLKGLEENSIDSIVTDPPYGLEFMGKSWDKFKKGENIAGGNTGKDTPYARSKALPAFYQMTNETMVAFQDFIYQWAKEALRVIKPGGYLLSFGGTRTYHRMACAIEDAGFEIRDQLMWVYGSGFPKSHNIGKAVDKLQGNEREDLGKHPTINGKGDHFAFCANYNGARLTKGNSQWEGYGTALKPAHEPIVLAMKPREGTFVNNVLKYGTGGINIDGCRVETTDIRHTGGQNFQAGHIPKKDKPITYTGGRFPANFIHDGIEEDWARYFYCAKASKVERNMGLEGFEDKKTNDGRKKEIDNAFQRGSTLRNNNHPTVKPLTLMKYLVRLITPPKGIVLDPFLGSGTTCMAAKAEGFNYIGIEKEPEYIKIAEARIKAIQKPLL